MSDAVIKVENISKKYELGIIGAGTLYHTLWQYLDQLKGNRKKAAEENEFWALKDINFEVKRGEVLGIIGKNGAGKSTLLKILSRITEPTTGKIEINGRVASLLEVGTGFHQELTGKENVFLNGGILGMSRATIKKKFDEIVDFSGVEKFIDTPVKRYSSGMRVRLAFAVAAHLEPEILVIDEVLSVGDAEFQKKCLGKMGELSGGGRTVLFVSHNMTAVKSLCSRGICLANGRITQTGNADKVVDYYLRTELDSLSSKRTLNLHKEGIKIVSIALKNKKGTYTSPLYNSEEILLQIVYKNVSKRKLNIGFQLKDSNGNFLMVIRGGTVPKTKKEKTLNLTIPAHTFNEHTFSFDLLVASEGSLLIRENNAISFKIEAGAKGIGRYMGKSKCPLVGNFKWDNNLV